jgi:hypothetical protein
MSDKKDLVSNNFDDLMASAGKSVAGAVPIVGSLLAELVSTLIPNQRIDRLSKYVVELEKRLCHVKEDVLRSHMHNDDCISLLEDGYIHASRALSDERREYIASIVSKGLSNDVLEVHTSKYLLGLLSELNDVEIIWLRFFQNQLLNGDQDFRNKHANILRPARFIEGSNEFEVDRKALQSSYKVHLERLGLVSDKLSVNRTNGLPEINPITGEFKVERTDITFMGRTLLAEINLIETDDD